MQQSTHFSDFASGGARRAATVTRVVARQPNWVVRIALTAVLIILAVPFLLLFLFALLVGVVLFGTLAGFNAIGNLFRGGVRRSDGRKNVRVIRRD